MNKEDLRLYNKRRKIGQVCFVTQDYRKTIEYLYRALRLGPWTIIAHCNEATIEVELGGRRIEEPFKFMCAFTTIGDMEIEVIEPCYGPTPYDDFLKKRGPGIHHIKESIPDNEALQKRVAELNANGTEIAFKGRYEEDIFYYLDTMKELGGMYELGNSALVSLHPTLVGYYPEK